MASPIFNPIKIMAQWAAIVILLSACSPMYKTTDQFVPPRPSSMTAIAISQCQQSKQYCEQNSLLRQRACKADAMRQAEMDYQQYKKQNPNDDFKKTVKDFYDEYPCNHLEDTCYEDYKQCYVSAGGAIFQKRECVAFCDS
jgi:hypothetical protein